MMRFYAPLVAMALVPGTSLCAETATPHPQITEETVVQGSDVTAPIPLKQDELAANGLGPVRKTYSLASVEPAAGPSRRQPPAQAAKTLQDYMFGYSETVPTSFPKTVDDMEGPAPDVQYR